MAIPTQQFYVLTEADAATLRAFLEAEQNRAAGGMVDAEWEPPQTPETYVAVPTCGEGIPARAGDTPGVAECCVFKLAQAAIGDPYKLEPIVNPDGTQVRREVYNIFDVAFDAALPPSEYYIVIRREKFGRWLCEYPNAAGGGGPLASTTTTTSTTTPNPFVDTICRGACRWVWNAAGQYWVPDGDSCERTTTTTSSTTSSTTTTSTTTTPDTECLCPPTSSTSTTTTSSTTSSSTTSSTTTTTPDCHCAYPTWCGSTDGECTYTSCTDGVVDVQAPCTSTTSSTSTTTCDCATTTTLALPPGCVECCYANLPVYGTVLIGSDCNGPDCHCPGPPAVGFCEIACVSCVYETTTTTRQPDPFCNGDCIYYFLPDVFGPGQGAWVLYEDNCQGQGTPCYCSPPSFNGNFCAPTTVQCQRPATSTSSTTSTTPPPCWQCYTSSTTTSSTTTTQPYCGAGCSWQWGGSSWGLTSFGCDPGCTCFPPNYSGQDTCHTARSECGDATTTTTTTTTSSTTTTTTTSSTTTSSTTTTVAPVYCCEKLPEMPSTVDPFCSEHCAMDGILATFSTGTSSERFIACYENCPPTTTTTTTTTTTPAGPCVGGMCNWIWNATDKEWVLDSDNCPGGCGCDGTVPGSNGSEPFEERSEPCIEE